MSIERPINKIVNLFQQTFSENPLYEKLAGGGSSRSYYRLSSGDRSVIGVYGSDIEENKCFISLARLFKNEGINVPDVIAVNKDSDSYLLEDLGDTMLLSLLSEDSKMQFAEEAIKLIVKLHSIPKKRWIEKVVHPPFSERLVRWDLNYFKYDFLKPAGVVFNENDLEDDFEKLVDLIANPSGTTLGFMYRDFQSRNIMVKDNEVYFIDFQGGREGPVIYDLVSFLWQAKAPFTHKERDTLTDLFITLTAETRGIDESILKRQVKPMVLFRTLQVLGAYGLRGLIERKSHFLESIPLAIRNLKELKIEGFLKEFPQLSEIVSKLCEIYPMSTKTKNEKLTITVGSFSFKKGYPLDTTGNGGGFVFDCRGLPNPGRYQEYKAFTGKDENVKEFLRDKKEVPDFINKCISLTEGTINNYLQRGFDSLQIWFGCTGGQHRSVFCAEETAKSLKLSYGNKINVIIIHREQDINP